MPYRIALVVCWFNILPLGTTLYELCEYLVSLFNRFTPAVVRCIVMAQML